ncbi:MAG TPA: hypothetical protein GX010_02055 [Erysipelotrichaceae bacterium]|nr:hypothetical protein [Erysipelotrichaceae bacterium]
MELFFIVLRNVVIALLVLYLLIVIFDVIFVCSFRSMLSRHDHDLFMNLANKKDNIEKLIPLLNSKNVKTDKKKVEALVNFDLKRVEHQDGEDAKLAREELASLSDYFLALCRDNKEIKSLDEFILIENNLNELTTLYVNHVVMYNADILGYNFWISFFPTRYIYRILKIKSKNIIS